MSEETNSLVVLSKASQMLAEVKNAFDAKNIMDMAVAAEHYAKKAKLGEEAISHAHSIKAQAMAKLGAFLKKELPHQGGRPSKTVTNGNRLSALSLSKRESVESQLLSDIATHSPKVFEKFMERKVSLDKLKHLKQRENASAFVPTPLPVGEFDIIYADPPWKYEHSVSASRDIENQYPTMELAEICAIDVPAADNCILFLWATNPKLEEAMAVIKAWGFEYRTNMVWVKDKIGMGYYVRQQHELLLIAKRGTPPMALEENRPSSVLQAVRSSKHSKKPDEVYALIEKMFPKRTYVELFARQARQGWEGWKNDSGL